MCVSAVYFSQSSEALLVHSLLLPDGDRWCVAASAGFTGVEVMMGMATVIGEEECQ